MRKVLLAVALIGVLLGTSLVVSADNYKIGINNFGQANFFGRIGRTVLINVAKALGAQVISTVTDNVPDRISPLDRILDEQVIGIVRLRAVAAFESIALAFADGGLHCLEITMNTPGALDGIRAIATCCPGEMIGAGTVLNSDMARRAIDSGAQFLVTPTTAIDIIRLARQQGIVVIPGALAPSEVYAAWSAGADVVKVFPASLGGASYIRSLKGPFPDIRLAPTEGVSAGNAAQFIGEGADVVCVGGWLVPGNAIHQGEFSVLTQRASELMAAVKSSRKGNP